MSHPRLTSWLAALALFVAPTISRAADPVISNINLRGLRIGATTTVTLDGSEFGKTPRLLLSLPTKQVLNPKSTDKQAIFDVTVDAAAVPGYYQLRLLTNEGVSTPLAIAVDALPQLPFSASVDQLPAALHGAITGSTTAETRFPGKAGQKVLIEIEAQRLGSKLRPVLHLYSPKRLQLGWAWTSPSLFGDARLEATLPEDGAYTVSVHDAEYAGQSPGFFRLRIGQWSFADQVFPPVIGKGQAANVELLGIAGMKPIAVPPAVHLGAMPLTWPKDGLWSGPRPFVRVGSAAEVVEQASPGKPQPLPAGQVRVSGRLLAPYEEDQFRIPVTASSKVRLEVFAERLGSPLDCALVVRNDKGEQLARAEDSPGTVDPVLEYAVPAKTDAIIVGVVDAQGRGGPRGVYRLVIDPPPLPGAVPDIRLVTSTSEIALPVGGRSVVPILVERRGYPGKIDISATTLASGLRLENTVVADDMEGTLVTIQRGEPAGEAALIQWRAKAADGLDRPVLLKGHPLERLQPWLASEIAIAPTAVKAADFQLDWSGLANDAGLVPGRKLMLPIKASRTAVTSPIRLTLLTSQQPTLVNNQPDPNKTIRLEKAEELAPKVADANLAVIVPAELPAPAYDVTIKGELLSPDKRLVLATAFAPVRRMAVKLPVVVKLDGPPRIEKVLDPKKEITVKVTGQVERKEGLAGDVTVELKGIPPGARAAAVNVKAGVNAFAIDLVLPPNVPAGEFKDLKLSASAIADPKTPNVRVRSRDVDLTLVVKLAGK